MKRSAYLLLLTACCSLGMLAHGQESPCKGRVIKIRRLIICDLWKPPTNEGIISNRSSPANYLNVLIMDDLRSLAIISDDALNISQAGDHTRREQLVRELHREVAGIEQRNEYRDSEIDHVRVEIDDTDKADLAFLYGGALGAIEERASSLADVHDYRDRIFELHRVADALCRRNHYSCKEPRRKYFLLF